MDGAERFEVFISQEEIARRVKELGEKITHDYWGKDLVLVCVLRGAILFMSDLSRSIDLPLSMDFLGLSSYGNETRSSGEVRVTQDLSNPIAGRDVLIVEDIVDTGLTLKFLINNLQARKPRSLKIATLLHKPSKTLESIDLEYVGFSIEDRFVVGYGLDYRQNFRNLPWIGFLKE